MKILVIGANGFLGSELTKVLDERHHEVLRGVSRKINERDIVVPLNSMVALTDSDKPDLVIDVSNKYIPEETSESTKKMSETILGVAKTIVRSNESWRVPIFQTTSYLQHCPPEVKPWNVYSEIRNQSRQMLEESTSASGCYFYDFVLHDTYGEKSRNKFLDLCLEAFQNHRTLSAGEGHSLVNLTHITDISNFIADQIEDSETAQCRDSRWDIKSNDTFTLRSLTKLFEDLTGIENIVEWGKLKNPRREVLQVWEIPNARNDFRNEISLQKWLTKKLTKEF